MILNNIDDKNICCTFTLGIIIGPYVPLPAATSATTTTTKATTTASTTTDEPGTTTIGDIDPGSGPGHISGAMIFEGPAVVKGKNP